MPKLAKNGVNLQAGNFPLGISHSWLCGIFEQTQDIATCCDFTTNLVVEQLFSINCEAGSNPSRLGGLAHKIEKNGDSCGWPVSRILFRIAPVITIHLGRLLPETSSSQPGSLGRRYPVLARAIPI